LPFGRIDAKCIREVLDQELGILMNTNASYNKLT
jgi:hypothetical protein